MPGKKWYNKVVRLIARLVSKKTKNKQATTIEYRIFFPCSRAIVANFPRVIILDLIRSKWSRLTAVSNFTQIVWRWLNRPNIKSWNEEKPFFLNGAIERFRLHKCRPKYVYVYFLFTSVFLWCHETLHRSASSFLNSNNLSKILTYYNRNVAENDKASSEKYWKGVNIRSRLTFRNKEAFLVMSFLGCASLCYCDFTIDILVTRISKNA